ncbi:MAG TPA: 50S ribosomal protein L9 [Saprospiraceae bacterium]|nr:50S ribosomal protein L9 [Saprospiraceae bacterium]HNT21852.1 50S ribosomal protein L9 [Saprospiraceae bacterium]
MEIIMLQDVEKVGDKHTVVKVKDGYGRNFLIPKGLAIIANKANRGRLEEMLRHEAAKEAKLVDTYREMAKKLVGQTLKIVVKAASTGKIFGSVSTVQIAQTLKDQLGLEVERKKISLPEEVKTLGTYTANVNFHKDVPATVAFEVVEG